MATLRYYSVVLVFGLHSFLLSANCVADQPTLEWIDQIGISGFSYGFDASADGLGNVYFSGRHRGFLFEPGSCGDGEGLGIAQQALMSANTIAMENFCGPRTFTRSRIVQMPGEYQQMGWAMFM